MGVAHLTCEGAMKSRFFGSLFAVMCFALEINEDNEASYVPEGGSPQPEMTAAAAEEVNEEEDDDATTGVHATEEIEITDAVQAEPGVDTTEQSADDTTDGTAAAS